MKSFIATILCLAASFVVHAGQADANAWKRSEIYVTAAVDIDAQGKIEHVQLLPSKESNSKDLQPALRALAETTFAKWEFQPATLNGHVAPAHTFLHGVFEFRENGKDYDGRVVYIGNGPNLIETAPSYPSNMVHSRVQAVLKMLAMVQPDGSLTDMQLESAQTTSGVSAGSFEQAAKRAMATWHAEPETVDGHPVKTWVRVPVSFDLRDVSGRQYAPELVRAAGSPKPKEVLDAGTEGVALDSPVKMLPQSP